MVTVTAVARMPTMSTITLVCGVVLVPAVARVLGVCVGLTLVDGSVTGLARAVYGLVGAGPAVVFVLAIVVLGRVVGVSRSGGGGGVRC
jgi:hypothetical protein